ncbi:S66 family peptidase [Roseateles chitosanitabidus]|uniref:S66 family peptidase n=1 Tax=Roseateles chitosanitabidus TaxID=65048 RepID=UPI000830C14D|nr:S66 peptidase family protein [Roseateles chitosanitabidus]
MSAGPAAIRFPRPLKRGDVVAVVAPSSGVRDPMHGRLDRSLDMLRERGFIVREGRSLRQQLKGASASGRERAAELMAVLLDPDVAAVMPPWGGELAIEVLEFLDFERLAASAPKWFSGFSDLSTVQVPLLIQAGWASLHGPNLMQLWDPALDAVSARIFDLWTGAGDRRQPAAPSTVARRLEGGDLPTVIEGRLIGGCLDALSRLAGTPFGDMAVFRGRLAGERPIVFFEIAELPPFEVARALRGLRLAGWFEEVAGVVFGRSAVAPEIASGGDFTELDAIQRALGDLPCPVLLDLDIGHVAPQWSIVQGARSRLDVREGQVALIQQLE